MRDMRRERCWRENEERRGGEDRKEMVTADLRMLGVTDWRKASHDRNQWRELLRGVVTKWTEWDRTLKLSHGPKWPM
jgi:hypothetical protein